MEAKHHSSVPSPSGKFVNKTSQQEPTIFSLIHHHTRLGLSLSSPFILLCCSVWLLSAAEFHVGHDKVGSGTWDMATELFQVDYSDDKIVGKLRMKDGSTLHFLSPEVGVETSEDGIALVAIGTPLHLEGRGWKGDVYAKGSVAQKDVVITPGIKIGMPFKKVNQAFGGRLGKAYYSKAIEHDGLGYQFDFFSKKNGKNFVLLGIVVYRLGE